MTWSMPGSDRLKLSIVPQQQRVGQFQLGQRMSPSIILNVGNHCRIVRPDQNMMACQNTTEMFQGQNGCLQF